MVCITVRMPREKRTASVIIRTPVVRHRIREVCTVSCRFLLSFEPMWRAVSALTPLESPMSRPVNSVISILVEPTAPSAIGPANLPTTAISDILNRTCRILENISGTL